jgi:pilus assembly protein Flp/PilA
MRKFLKEESGATAIEYGMIAAATGMALMGVMPSIGEALQPIFTSLAAGFGS